VDLEKAPCCVLTGLNGINPYTGTIAIIKFVSQIDWNIADGNKDNI
jgi:hypothetical protein